jgi:hypothetical protein
MALFHRATITPTKADLIASWAPSRPWGPSERDAIDVIGSYRFDDPDGRVGMETHLVTAGGALFQIPLTYREEPCDAAADAFVTEMEHSVLGTRWVYDGCGDPMWASTLSTAILTGGTQAQMVIEHEGAMVDVPPRMRVRGSGSAQTAPEVTSVDSVHDDGPLTRVVAGSVVLTLARLVGTPVDGEVTLSGTIGDEPATVFLAGLSG